MDIVYKKGEGSMLIPEFESPKGIRQTGKYGTMRKRYLFRNHRHRYEDMLLEGTLSEHIQKIDSEAVDMLARLTERMERENPPPEGLSFQERTIHFREIHLEAERIVLDEIVYWP